QGARHAERAPAHERAALRPAARRPSRARRACERRVAAHPHRHHVRRERRAVGPRGAAGGGSLGPGHARADGDRLAAREAGPRRPHALRHHRDPRADRAALGRRAARRARRRAGSVDRRLLSFLDILLRGVLLAGAALTLGGVVFARVVLRAGPGTKPGPAVQRTLRLVALGAAVVAAAQLAVSGLALATLGAPAAPAFARTTFATVSLARVVLAGAVAILALSLVRRAGGGARWSALAIAAVLVVAASAAISHAMARVDHRPLLLAL